MIVVALLIIFFVITLQTTRSEVIQQCTGNACSEEARMVKLRLFLEPPELRTSLSTYFEVDVPLALGPVPAESLLQLAQQFEPVCNGQTFLKGWDAEHCSKELLGEITEHLRRENLLEEDREGDREESSASPFIIQLLSPVSAVYYLNGQGEPVMLDVRIDSNVPRDATLCYRLVEDLASVTIERKCENLATHMKGLAEVPTISLKLFQQNSGQYTVHVNLISPHLNASDQVTFFARRKALRRKLFGTVVRPRQAVKIVALAIKYGIHGDDARISVAVGGRMLLDQSLASLFRIEDKLVSADVTESQRRRTLSKGAYVLDSRDREKLSDHLALQAATAFGDGCEGVSVTTAGVTYACADPLQTRARWREVAQRVDAATRLLLGLSGDVSFAYDVAIFVAAHQDTQSRPTTAFTHARAAFAGVKLWGVEDNCESTGDPTLLWEQEDISTRRELDAELPLVPSGFTADVSSTMKRLLRRIKAGGEPFTVSCPGPGWDTTLAHRWFVSEGDATLCAVELSLMEELGVVAHTDPELYFLKWNRAMLDSDVIAVLPGTRGRVRDYCTHGLRQQLPSLFLQSSKERKVKLPSEYVDARHQREGSDDDVGYFRTALRRCDTVDAKQLAGVRQLVDPDTWWGELEGMRVLIVHPFAKTIQRQYRGSTRASTSVFPVRYEGALFPSNPKALPHFRELHTYAPTAGRSKGSDWRESLKTMEAELRTLANSFDVALLSCGAWGPLLQHFIRRDLNRSAISLGDNLQLHFGILGEQHKTQVDVMALSTAAWTWPTKTESQAFKQNSESTTPAICTQV